RILIGVKSDKSYMRAIKAHSRTECTSPQASISSDLVKCERWETGCHHCPQPKVMRRVLFDQSKTLWRLKKRWFSGFAKMQIVIPSQWLADLAAQSFLKQYPIKVINNGIDLTVFRPAESNFRKKHSLNAKKVILGVAAGWEIRKGLDVFIRLAEELPDEYRIVLVGTNDRIDKELPKKIISIHQTMNQQELAEIYSAADVYVNPTREDNYPTVNMEAIACGTPVITFRTGGSPEIPDDSCGCVVEIDDVEAMKAEIIRICTEKPYSVEQCLERAKSFDRNAKFDAYVKLYSEVLK
ncbi:MAG: glycosyltransferase, partial [Lentisphaeria bacterium]|nr:glycosyltransferase [Lentisphaeria bacterium]